MASFQNRFSLVPWETLQNNAKNIIVLSGCRHSGLSQAILRKNYKRAKQEALRLVDILGRGQVYLEMINDFSVFTKRLLSQLCQLHRELKIPIVATNNVRYLNKKTFPIHDLLVCLRTQTRLTDLHPQRPLNGENYFALPLFREQFKTPWKLLNIVQRQIQPWSIVWE